MATVLHVLATLDRGGTETTAVALAAAFAARGHRNHIVALRGAAAAAAEAGALGVVPAAAAVAEMHGVLPSGRCRRAAAFARLCRRLRPDAVVFHLFGVDHVALAAVARFAGVPRAVAAAGNPAPQHRRALLLLSRAVDVPIVSASEAVAAGLATRERLPRGSAVVHNGVDVEAIATGASRRRCASGWSNVAAMGGTHPAAARDIGMMVDASPSARDGAVMHVARPDAACDVAVMDAAQPNPSCDAAAMADTRPCAAGGVAVAPTGRRGDGALLAHATPGAEAIATDRGAFVIGTVARLDPIKDHPALLAAFAALPASVGGRLLRLVLVGDGPTRPALETLADRLGIAARVDFRGARADVPAELARMDLFVLPATADEGFGVALVEALAAGVPAIATAVPATREVLAGGLGTLVPPADPAALAAALREALAAPPTPPPTAEIARRYGLARMADGYEAVLWGTR